MKNSTTTIEQILRGFGGAVAGAALGYGLYWLLLRYGLHGLVLPGATLGLGCGYAMRRRSVIAGILCGLAAYALGIIAEWSMRPFLADARLTFFVTHLGDLPTATHIMLVAGALLGGWFGMGRRDHRPPLD